MLSPKNFALLLILFGLESGALAQTLSPSVANVPPSDPVPANVPLIPPSMRGAHPRLLFTANEIALLKRQIATDATLGKAYQDAVAWCKGFKCPKGAPDIITQGDTPAIWKSLGLFPALAYVYALDRDPVVKQKIVDVLQMMLAQPYWSPDNKETDNSMGAACNMAMVGLLFDSVCNDLPPDLRAKLAEKMLLHCRRMYYLGHKGLGPAIKYWQADPQPNHRWYRDAGLASCLLAIADEKNIDTRYLLHEFKAEMDFVMKWYPPDGDCHEGTGYQSFGYLPILMAATMSDRMLGTDYLKTSGLKNACVQHLYYWVPGRNSDISYGDDQNGAASGFGNNDAAFFFGPHATRDKNMQAALFNRMTKTSLPGKNGSPSTYEWAMLAFYDPTVERGDYKALPLARLFPDMGAATMRDSWEDDAVVFTFKCGPYGGYKLNDYRMATPDEYSKPHYINIAHDDPDANEFALSLGGGFIFHPGVYSTLKITRQHNTITVDDKGQLGEGDGYTQPTGTLDMRTLSYLTGWKSGEKGRIIIEGEAGSAYRGMTGPELKKQRQVAAPVLNKFRRTAIWMPGEYILVLDDIAAGGAHKITWRGGSPAATSGTGGHFTATTEAGGKMDFQMLSSRSYDTVIEKVILDGRWGNVPVEQFQFSAAVPSVKFACLLDPWKKSPVVQMSETGGVVTLSVRAGGFTDTWTWHEAKDAMTPSCIDGLRDGKPLISLTGADKAPRE